MPSTSGASPNARTKRSIPHIRKLKADKRVAGAAQQTGFKRAKRYGAKFEEGRLEVKRDPFHDLRMALDGSLDGSAFPSGGDFHVVHDENFFDRLQHMANGHRYA